MRLEGILENFKTKPLMIKKIDGLIDSNLKSWPDYKTSKIMRIGRDIWILNLIRLIEYKI